MATVYSSIPRFGGLGVGIPTNNTGGLFGGLGKTRETGTFTEPTQPTNNSALEAIFATLPNVGQGLLDLRSEQRVYDLQRLRTQGEIAIRSAVAKADSELRKAQGIALTSAQIQERNAQRQFAERQAIEKSNEPFWKKYSVGISGGIAFLVLGFIVVTAIGGFKPKFRGKK